MEIAFYIYYLKVGRLEKINNQPDDGFSTKTDAINHLKTILRGFDYNYYLILDTYS